MLELPSLEELGVDYDESTVPKITDQFIQQYIAGRDSFLEREDATRSDAAFRSSLTPMAQEACKIVSRIRQHEHKTLWTAEAEQDPGVYPGMPYSIAVAQEKMEKSILWEIVQKMPKGSLLHAHFDAMFDMRFLLGEALKIEGFGFSCDMPLTDDKSLDTALIRFQYCGKNLQQSDIYDPTYRPDTWVPLQDAAKSYKPTKTHPDFITWVVHRASIRADETLDPATGTGKIWQKFKSCFVPHNHLILYEPILRLALRRLFAELVEDGIRWVELRWSFLLPFYREGQTTPETDHIRFLIIFDEELGRFQDTEEGQYLWGARFIWTGLRFQTGDEIRTYMGKCLQHKAMFPHLIAAYDLVGHEEGGATLLELLPVIFWFRKACAQAQMVIPFVFHAGETIETGSETAKNLYDAVLLGTRRIGHAFALYKHPLLLETVKTKHIAIESCPLSNEVLKLTSSVGTHPLPALLARGVKCTISNDDPAILGGPYRDNRNGSSTDFWSILQSWDDLGLAGLGSLAEESVRYALFEVPETVDEDNTMWLDGVRKGINGTGVRAARMTEWRMEWEDFMEWIVIEYAADWANEEDMPKDLPKAEATAAA